MPAMTIPLTEDMKKALNDAMNDAGKNVKVSRSPEAERFARIEHLLQKGLKCIEKNNAVTPGCLINLVEACDIAMDNTVRARLPECGEFGGIAQNLGFVVDRLYQPEIEAVA